MNGFKRLMISAAVLLAWSIPTLGQGVGDPVKPGQVGVRGKQARAGKGKGMAGVVTMPVGVIASIASLNEDQKTKITAIQSKLKTDLAAEADKTRHKALTARATEEIRAVLTPAQISTLQQALPMVRLLNQSKAIPANALASVNLTADQKEK